MRIAGFDILLIEVPMRVTVQHALAERMVARNLLVAARDEAGKTGWGESCPRPYVTGEILEGARDLLRTQILPSLVGLEFDGFDELGSVLTSTLDGLARDQQAAFCAAELALLDLAGLALGTSVGDLLGPVREQTVFYTGVVASTSEEGVRAYCRMLHDFGAREIKIKVGADLDDNLRFLDIAREVLGEDVELRLDANCAWDADEAIRQLEAMAPYRLAGVEQPVPGADFVGMRTVTAAGLVPVVADESLASLDDARRLVDERACDIFNVRVSKVGGLLNAGRIHRCARAAGLVCQLGAQVGETGILSAAGRHYATRCDGIRWREGSYDSILLEAGITAPDITVGPGGRAEALTAPGLGVVPVPERLEQFTTQKISVA